MAASLRSPSSLLAVGVVVAAIFGYLLGSGAKVADTHQHQAAASAPTRPLFAGSVILEAPIGWQSASGAPAIPGLPIVHPVSVAPGQLAEGGPAPLPATFLAQLSAPPRAEVVSLPQSQAYRYSQLHVRGIAQLVSVYVIPSPGGAPSVLACYVPASALAELRTCEQIVTTLRPVATTSTDDLTPNTAFAEAVSAAVGGVDSERVALRREMQTGANVVTVARAAARLAHSFASSSAVVARLEPPLVAGPAQVALATAMKRAGSAYAALAAAASARNEGSYESARAQVGEAEAGVDGALQGFALLGYAHP